MTYPKRAETEDSDHISGIHEAHIDNVLLTEISAKIGKSIRTRIMTCLRRVKYVKEGEETNLQLLLLYESISKHPYFKEGLISFPGIGEPTLFALELYLYKKGMIQERQFEQILMEKAKNWENKPDYLDID